MYAKIFNGSIIKYPYQWADFMADNNNTQGLNPSDLLTIFPQTAMGKAGYSVVEVQATAQPAYDLITQDCTEGTPALVNGVWAQTWNVMAASAAEQAQRLIAQGQNTYNATINGGIVLTSTGTPTINGTYSVTPEACANISGVMSGISNGMGLPGSGSTFGYLDSTGNAHAFDATHFTAFAKTVRDYVYQCDIALATIQKGGTATFPSNQVTIA